MVIKYHCVEMNQEGKQHLILKKMRLSSKKTVIYLESMLPYLLKLLVMEMPSLPQNLHWQTTTEARATFRNTLSMAWQRFILFRATFGKNKALA